MFYIFALCSLIDRTTDKIFIDKMFMVHYLPNQIISISILPTLTSSFVQLTASLSKFNLPFKVIGAYVGVFRRICIGSGYFITEYSLLVTKRRKVLIDISELCRILGTVFNLRCPQAPKQI